MKYAVCNELFGRRPLREAVGIARRAGYEGLELAPYTVFGDFSAGAFRAGLAEAKLAFAANGLAFAGFHWLLVGPEGMHATCPDEAVRRRTWDHVARLVDAAGELGGGVLVLGSPKQRSSTGGATREDAVSRLAEELSRIAPRAAAAGSPILVEALASDQSDVVNTMAEARAMVESIGSPGIGCMFDFHNTGDESSPWEELIRSCGALLRHVHANEPDGGCPRRGGADIGPAFDALREIGYTGWVSVEIFEEPGDPAATLGEAMARFRECDREPAPDDGGLFPDEQGERK
jgi:D-psicose/D-tagatose/L-ribulose 3-epimerase